MFNAPLLRPTSATHPVTTAHLAQTMSLLELTAAELRQKVEAELANNPALELREEKHCLLCGCSLVEGGLCSRCVPQKNASPEEAIIFVSPRDNFHSVNRAQNDLCEDLLPPASEDLPTFVLRQISPDLQPPDRVLAAHILTNLDDDGLLEIPLSEIARYHHKPISRVENVLRQIQRAEPIGVGSASPRDALLVQLEVLSENQPDNTLFELAKRAIQLGMASLSRHQYTELGRSMGISTLQVQEVIRFIGENLNPYPARAFWGDIRQGNRAMSEGYSSPDIIITPNGNDGEALIAEVISPFVGLLQINPLFRQALAEASSEQVDQWQEDLERADLLVKCLQQRTNTMVRLTRRILALQRDFILHGDKCLQPMTRARLANELRVNESTISRAVAGKTVQLPSGHIIPLSKFFDRSLHIRVILTQIIACETSPLSDSDLASRLKEHGFHVARRTVAKYRTMEGILPSHLRGNRSKIPPSHRER